MKLETFFEKFDLFADAPDAVAKMRELVLELAVQGRLVSQNPNDEPADSLCEPDDELAAASLYEVPHGWIWTRLTKLAEINGGFAFKSTAYTEEGTRVVRISDFDEFGFKDHKVVRHPFTSDLQKFTLAEFNILMAMTGGSVGKSYLVRTLPEPMVVNQRVATIKVLETATPSYIDIVIRSEMTQEVIRKAKNSTNDNISMGDIKGFAIPLPPLAEQRRIVAKVDELMALCDRLEAQQQEREEQASKLSRASLARFAEAPTVAQLPFLFHDAYAIPPADLRKSILTLAFAGKLVPQDPNDEPASVLLEKARTEKARLIERGVVKKEPWADKLQDATTLYDLPPGWEWTHVSDVVEKVTVGYVGPMKEQYCKSGVPFLRCQNVRENRYEPIGLTFISEEFHRSIAKSTLRPGDVVVTRSGNVGVTCVIPDGLPEANCSDLVIVKRPLALVPAFLSYFINSIAAGQIEAKTVGIALTHFNTQSVAQMTVALPPLAEQRRIVAKVDELMALVDALETQLATARTTAASLLSALVTELTQL